MLSKAVHTIIFFCIIGLKLSAQHQPIDVEITGLRNPEGYIILNIYTNEESFDKEDPEYLEIFSKTGMKDSSLTFVLNDMPPGNYGIALIDDENNNGKLDRKILIPVEGFGFSDFVFSGRQKPRFDQFCFTHTGQNRTKTIIKLTYF